MKITKTEFDMKVNEGSSWKIYICDSIDTMHTLMAVLNTAGDPNTIDNYYHVQGCEVLKDCRVPEIFHDRGYWMVSVEHNHGDWNKPQTYELFIVG